jgi:hypothetical protein
MDDDEQLCWLMERNHESYLTWVALWLASMLGVITILASVISRQDILSPHHLVLVWLLYWGLVSGMIFSVYRLVNILKAHLSWAIRLTNSPIISKAAKEERGRISRTVVCISKEEKAEIRESVRVSVYFIHLLLAGFFLWLALSEPFLVIMSIFIIFVLSVFLDLLSAEKPNCKT